MKDKEITIYDIAEKLKISPATVSMDLNNNPAISTKTYFLKKTTKKLISEANHIQI